MAVCISPFYRINVKIGMPAYNLCDKDKTSITERIKAILLQIFQMLLFEKGVFQKQWESRKNLWPKGQKGGERPPFFSLLPTSPNEAEFRLFLAGFGIDRPQPGNIDNFIFFVRKKIPGMELLAVPFQIETFIPIWEWLGSYIFQRLLPPPGVPSSTKRSRGDMNSFTSLSISSGNHLVQGVRHHYSPLRLTC